MKPYTSSIFLTQVLASLLILLWVYTALTKLADFTEFKNQLNNQNFNPGMTKFFLWLIPLSELFAGTLLLFKTTRVLGFILSTFLMLAFTGYVGLVVAGFYQRIPCSCGGVLRTMGWKTHLVFNIAFLIISMIGTLLTYHERRKPGNL